MAYQIKCKNFSQGFTLLEFLIAIAIALLLFNVSTSVFNSFKVHNNLEITVGGVVEALRFAGASAQSGKGDAKWGVEIFSDKLVIFKGDSYASRDSAFDEIFNFVGGVSASGLGEIVFEKVSGSTTTIGTVTLTNSGENKNIVINEKGTVTY